MSKPALSLILCSRNDQYMGNSLWRLQTALNYVAENVQELGREEDVEIIVADWGSEIPLREALELNRAAANITWFVVIPPETAVIEQKDSPFPEVLGLNAAARRANGEYIGRIDQDTLVGKRFLDVFFQLLDGARVLGNPLDSTVIWAGRVGIPYRFSVRCPPFWQVRQFIRWFGHSLRIDTPGPKDCFFNAPVGIWLAPRHCWEDCRGYDERFIYWGFMEIEMIYRLTKKYSLVHWEKNFDCDFYHLEHYHPAKQRITSRRMNREEFGGAFRANGDDWGLIKIPLDAISYSGSKDDVKMVPVEPTRLKRLAFLASLLPIGILMVWDNLLTLIRSSLRKFLVRWTLRASVAWTSVRGHPVSMWPGILRGLWQQRLASKRLP